MKTVLKNLTLITLSICAFTVIPIQAQTTIFSDNFEGPESDGWAKWIGYPNVTVTDNQNRSIETTGNDIYLDPNPGTFVAGEGDKSGKLWQVYWYPGSPEAPLSSATFAAWSGPDMIPLQSQQIQFDLQSFTSQYDSYSGGDSQAYMFVKFFNSDYSYFYDWAFYTEMLSDNPTDSWQANTLSFTVPVDAAIMQIGIENAQINGGGGSVYVDSALISVIPEPSSLALLALGLGIPAILRRRK